MTKPLFLQAFDGTNTTIPVWFMRQAGRFLPEYRALRKNHTLDAMFRNAEIAAQVTCLPVDLLGVDAAILFADILTLPSHLGFEIRFVDGRGPVIENPLTQPADVNKMHDFDDIPHIRKTIELVNQRLNENIPLIGFAGSPFTALTYLIEGGSSSDFKKTLAFAADYPKEFQQALQILTRNTIAYLNLQKQAGIKVFQLFDTWAGILRPLDYEKWVLPHIQTIFQNVDLSSIYYLKNSRPLLSLMEQSGADFLSVCETVDLASDPVLAKTDKGIQGNLYNKLLYADDPALEKKVLSLLEGAKKFKRYIFNLSHGVFPDVEVDKVKFVVEKVHEFKWR